MSKTNDKVINKRLLRAAYHQAGHTVAYLLTNRPFEFVTIDYDSDTLGYIKAPYNYWSVDLKSQSFYKPSCLKVLVENSFISIAGNNAEKIIGFSFYTVDSQLGLQNFETVTLSF